MFLEADDHTLARRFSETRRPHPLGTEATVQKSLRTERELLAPIRSVADHIIDTSKFNVHELREVIGEKFSGGRNESSIRIDINSFGYRYGVPPDSDLVFDVRFLPNPNYIPEFKKLTGRHPSVARYIRSFPQTIEFIDRISELVDLSDPALHSRRQELSDHRVRLHRRASSLGDDRGRDPQTAGARGFQGERDAPGYWQVNWPRLQVAWAVHFAGSQAIVLARSMAVITISAHGGYPPHAASSCRRRD